MALRNFTLDSSRAYRGGHATDRLRAYAVDYFPGAFVPILDDYFPGALVPILDDDLSDADASEPDGVNDFVRQLGSEQLDQQ